MHNGVTLEQLELLRSARPDYHWKVQTANERGCMCVCFVDARDVMDVLDEVVGPGNWKEDPPVMVGNRLMVTISIRVNGEWVSKTDTGTDSAMEAEKGGVSDAFKRAAVKWGIGRFLYRLPVVNVPSMKDNRGKWVPGENGQRIWDLTEYIRKTGKDPGFKPGHQAPAQPKAQPQKPAPAPAPAGQAEPEEQPPFADAVIRKPEDVLAALKKQVMAEGKRVFGVVGKAELLGELQTLADAYELGPLQELDVKRAGFLLQALKKRPSGIAQLDQKRAERHPIDQTKKRTRYLSWAPEAME